MVAARVPTERPVSTSAELIELFDGAAKRRAPYVDLFEKNDPGSVAALKAWASSRSLPIEHRTDSGGVVYTVKLGGGRIVVFSTEVTS